MDDVISGKVGLSCTGEQVERASKEHFSMVSASVSDSRILR